MREKAVRGCSGKMGDADATQARRDVVADVDEILEQVIDANMSRMPYDVYSELFDAVDGLGVEIENLQAENAKLRELVHDLHKALFLLDIDQCQACPRDNINGPCTKFMVCGSDKCSIEEDMRKLGIEVES